MNGLLGNNIWSQIGMGLLSSNAPSLTPQNPMQHIQQQMLLGNQLQQQKSKEEIEREKMAMQQKKLQLEIEAMQNPQVKGTAVGGNLVNPYTGELIYEGQQERKIIKGADGYNYDANTGERILPEVEKAINYNQPFLADGTPNVAFQGYQENLAQKRANKVTVEGDKELPYKLETGFMLKDPENPSMGVVPIPGGGKDRMTSETAAKAASMQAAQSVLPLIDSLLFNEDGSTNNMNLITGAVNAPQSEGKELNSYYELGIQAITRSETGAAMQPSELSNTRKRFQPSIMDNERSRKIKYEMYKEFLSGTLKLIRPDGGLDGAPSFDATAFEAEYNKRLNETSKPESNINDLVSKYAD